MEEGNFNSHGIQKPNIKTGTGHVEVRNKQPERSVDGVSFIVVLGRDFAKQLEVPQDFASTFNSYIPHRIFIETNMIKTCWKIELKDRDGRLFFQDGWSEFVAAHSLEVGNIVMFECEECAIFKVKFFHSNGCEKSPVLDSKVGILNEIWETTTDEDGESEDFGGERKNVGKKTNMKKTRMLTLQHYKEQHEGNRKHSLEHLRARRTKVSICRKSVCFSITLHKRKKYQFFQVFIPKAISLQKKLSSKQKVELQDEKGRCWPVTITHPRDGRVTFSQGWKDFLLGNEVSPGDTLKFEFISDDLLYVHVIKESKVSHHHQRRRNQAKASGSQIVNGEYDNELITHPTDGKLVDSSAVTVAKNVYYELTSSTFSVVWRSNTSGGFLYIPKAFVATQNIMDKESIVLRDPEGKCWPLEVSHKSDGCTVLTKGWPEFWEGLRITVGDTLMFKFVSEYLIQATIDKSKALGHATK